jgi:glycerol-3-phosphate dehydrogenase
VGGARSTGSAQGVQRARRQVRLRHSEILSREETLERLPTIKTEGLRGGVVYYDGQFDDSRLLVNLVQTARRAGGRPAQLRAGRGPHQGADGFVDGVVARDVETGRELRVPGKVVINATGPFADGVRRLAEPRGTGPDRAQPGHPPRVRPVVPAGRQRHHGAAHARRPRDVRDPVARAHARGHHRHAHRRADARAAALEEEVAFILETAAQYLHKAPTRDDVLSVFVGIRPLVRSGDSKLTAALSRDHTIHIDASGLLTTTGGKWTTYRHMAEDTVNQAAELARLPERPCVTKTLNVHGFHR